jgi:hypothetical protein
MFTEDSTIQEIQSELDKLPKNQQILFATDCVRSVLHHFEDKYPDDKRPRKAIEMAESLKYDPEIAAAAANAANAANAATAAAAVAYAIAAWSAAAYAAWSATNAAYAAAWSVKAGQSWEFINSLFKHAYNPNPFPNQWKTPDVLNISKVIIQERDFDSCKFLADALTDAGCNDEQLLKHIRIDIIGLSDWTLFNLRQDDL